MDFPYQWNGPERNTVTIFRIKQGILLSYCSLKSGDWHDSSTHLNLSTDPDCMFPLSVWLMPVHSFH